MKVSVVVCTYSMDLYEHFQEAVESVLEQTYEDVELVLVSDGSEAVYEQMVEEYGDREDTILHCNEENLGLSGSRNNAIDLATGDVLAFIDDDAIAEEDWIEELVKVYEETDAIATGGKMTPIWVDGKPEFLPEEFYWLVGVTHRGFAKP